ncbi:MAG: uracil phosphoribosyltransferase [Lachnospiraceae bacterium]|nr:uracil phosphoribosyltransferase [Lachnospiraceae bacterium]
MLKKYCDNVFVFDHPLIKHKITMMRDKNTGTNEFRAMVGELGMLMGYEALSDLPITNIDIETPICKTIQPILDGKKLAIVPILRAGLGMVSGITSLVPTAKIGHIGMYRDEKTLKPVEYFCKLPNPISQRVIVVVDPMLATGGSATDAINLVKQKGGIKIKFVSIIAAPQGIEFLHKNHPDVQVYVGCVDEKLNENGYIVPGLGDAGDRIFGTK